MNFKIDFGHKLIIISVLLVGMTFNNLNLANEALHSVFLNYAEIQTKKISSMVISLAVADFLLKDFNDVELMKIDEQPQGTGSLTFNSISLNQMMVATNDLVQSHLMAVENGRMDDKEWANLGIQVSNPSKARGIVYEIPFGLIFQNVLLANLGPKIPVKFSLIGNVISQVRSHIQSYGINNVLVTISVQITVRMQVMIPLASRLSEVMTDIPVAMKLIQGVVPTFYYGSQAISPALTIPLSPEGGTDE